MTEQELMKAREAQRAYQREWRRKNPEKVRERNLRYWAKKAAEMEAAENKEKGDQNDGNQDT